MVLLRVDEVGGGTVGCSGEPNGWGEKGEKDGFYESIGRSGC